jgi:exosortase E/protease (VPEID-CTERM system)
MTDRTLWRVPFGLLALLSLEILLVVPLQRFLVDFDCWAIWGDATCGRLTAAKASFYTLIPALACIALLLAPEREALRRAALRPWPLAVNLGGVAIFFLPALWLQGAAGAGMLGPSLAAWSIGVLLAGAGALAMLVPDRAVWRAKGGLIVLSLAVGLAAPFLARDVQGLWNLRLLSDATFHAVAWVLQMLGHPVSVDYAARSIGNGDFTAFIAPLCSGIEGIGLILFFVSLYLWLFRRELRFPAAFWLYPVGIIASFLLNIARIAILIRIAIGGNVDLAVNGFHSHAGWLMFTLLALALVGGARLSGLFATGRPPAPFFADPIVARILPFAVFMASALLASTFANQPALVYPLRALAMSLALAPFWRQIAGLGWRFDPLALGAGAAIGGVWILTAPPPALDELSAALAGLTPGLLGLWIAARLLGTVVLVPIIEELFFRDYLLARFGGKGLRGVLALGGTALLFGLLHDRVVLAFVSGLVFGGLRLRQGRVGDAILAHMVANAVIAAAALWQDDWSLI